MLSDNPGRSRSGRPPSRRPATTARQPRFTCAGSSSNGNRRRTTSPATPSLVPRLVGRPRLCQCVLRTPDAGMTVAELDKHLGQRPRRQRQAPTSGRRIFSWRSSSTDRASPGSPNRTGRPSTASLPRTGPRTGRSCSRERRRTGKMKAGDERRILASFDFRSWSPERDRSRCHSPTTRPAAPGPATWSGFVPIWGCWPGLRSLRGCATRLISRGSFSRRFWKPTRV